MSESDLIYLCFLEFGYFYFYYIYPSLLCHSAVFLDYGNVRVNCYAYFVISCSVRGCQGSDCFSFLMNGHESVSAVLFYVTPEPVVS